MTTKVRSSATARNQSAPLMEIFSSIQGEGLYVGQPQVFVRFARCPIRCLYCDTPESWRAEKTYRVWRGKTFETHLNPATAKDIVEHCRTLARQGGQPKAASLTGGEPLLYPDFLLELCPRLRKAGFRTHLETAGIHPEGLQKILAHVDHLSMDWKLPSTLERGDFSEEQSVFLECGWRKKRNDLVVKMVLVGNTSQKEFRKALAAIKKVSPEVPLILQPVTPFGKVRRPPSADEVAACLKAAANILPNVSVLPQLHPLMGWK